MNFNSHGNYSGRSATTVVTKTDLKTKVCVILAYYNGSRFIDDQLQSIETQKGVDVNVFISNDCSDLGNAKHIQDTIAKHSKVKKIFQQRVRKGSCENFLHTLIKVEDSYDFYAFSDQDDIWDDDKLLRAINTHAEYGSNEPMLYCSRTRLIDASGCWTGKYSTLFKKKPTFQNALTQNIAGGNTMVFNRAAYKMLAKASKNIKVISHDWWVYLIISGSGGRVIYDEIPSMSYRQHGNNLIGSNTSALARLRRFNMLMRGDYRRWNTLHSVALQQNRHLLTEKNKFYFDSFMSMREKKLIERVKLFFKIKLYRQTLLGTVSLFIGVILKKV